MTLRSLLTLTASLEAVTGLILMAMPTVLARLLFGAEIAGVTVSIARLAGFALLSLGIACWPGGNTTAAYRAMLAYNGLATVYFLGLGIGGSWVGPLLWPAAALHGILWWSLVRAR